MKINKKNSGCFCSRCFCVGIVLSSRSVVEISFIPSVSAGKPAAHRRKLRIIPLFLLSKMKLPFHFGLCGVSRTADRFILVYGRIRYRFQLDNTCLATGIKKTAAAFCNCCLMLASCYLPGPASKSASFPPFSPVSLRLTGENCGSFRCFSFPK